MSLVSTYVRADDGKMYRNPVLSGADWFICFDDDDPVELVIKVDSELTPKDVFMLLGMKKIPKPRYNGTSGRIFSDANLAKDDWKWETANSWFFNIFERINHEFITKHESTVDPKTLYSGVIYDFKN